MASHFKSKLESQEKLHEHIPSARASLITWTSTLGLNNPTPTMTWENWSLDNHTIVIFPSTLNHRFDHMCRSIRFDWDEGPAHERSLVGFYHYHRHDKSKRQCMRDIRPRMKHSSGGSGTRGYSSCNYAPHLASPREVTSKERGDISQGTSICAIINASSPLYCVVWYCNRGIYWIVLGPLIAWAWPQLLVCVFLLM